MIRLELQGRPPRDAYRLAERSVWCDLRLPELEAFRVVAGAPAAEIDRLPGELGRSPRTAIAGGLADAAGRRIDFWRTGDGYLLEVDGIGGFEISSRGERIVFQTNVARVEPHDLAEIVLGPALIFALALQGRFCLHASAVEVGGEGLVFLGTSGAGKSTLAAELPELLPRSSCLADDVMPVSSGGGALRLLPHYPQLKYAPQRQPGVLGEPSRPLKALGLLEWAPSLEADVTVEPLRGVAAAMALARHTVAARLFTGELLRDHLDWCARVAQQRPVYRLRMPKRRQALPGVAAWIERITAPGLPEARGPWP